MQQMNVQKFGLIADNVYTSAPPLNKQIINLLKHKHCGINN